MKRVGYSLLLCFSLTAFGQVAPQQQQSSPATVAPTPRSGPPGVPQPETLDAAQSIIVRQFGQLQDWPQLKRYADANTTLAAPKPGEDRVVFMGDSITDLWPLADYFPGKPYIDRGISGQTTPQMLIRMRPDVIDLQPRAVLILAGTNDIAGNTGPMSLNQIEDNYASMAELASAHDIRVIFSSVLPVHDKGKSPQTLRRSPEKIRALNDWLKRYCAEHGLVYLDYYNHMLGPDDMLRTDLAADGLHPNADGYKIMAPLAEQAIEQALKPRNEQH